MSNPEGQRSDDGSSLNSQVAALIALTLQEKRDEPKEKKAKGLEWIGAVVALIAAIGALLGSVQALTTSNEASRVQQEIALRQKEIDAKQLAMDSRQAALDSSQARRNLADIELAINGMRGAENTRIGNLYNRRKLACQSLPTDDRPLWKKYNQCVFAPSGRNEVHGYLSVAETTRVRCLQSLQLCS